MKTILAALLGGLSLIAGMAPASRAASVPIPGCVLVEEFAVPADGSSVVSTTDLANGKVYVLQASVTHDIYQGKFADGEYYLPPGGPMDYCAGSTCDYGIEIDHASVDAAPIAPDWGAYDPEHVYEIEYVGAGASLSINFHDDYYVDNGTGDMTFAIFEQATVPPPGPGGERAGIFDHRPLHSAGS